MNVISMPIYMDTPAGRIPAEWQVKLIGELTHVSAGGTPVTTNEAFWNPPEIPWMSSGEVHFRRIHSTEKRISKLGLENSAAKIFPKKSVVIALAGQGKTRGCVAVLEAPIATNQSLAAIYPCEHFETDFLFHNLDWRYKELRSISSGEGGRGGLNLSIIKSIVIGLPPLSEQRKIASILTAVDDKLDIIARQIEVTKALKRGLMQTLFSRGVGNRDTDGRWLPHTEFKNSELGEIPLKWSADKLNSHVCKVGSGVTPKGGSDSYISTGIPLIRSQNVLVGRLSLDDVVFIAHEQHEKMRNSALAPSDVLLNITGASIGRCAVLPADFKEGNVNQHVCIIRPTSSLNPHFLCQYLNSDLGQKQVGKFQAGGNREGLNYQQIRSFDVPVPSRMEQDKIAEILESVDKKVDVLISKKIHFQTLKRTLMQKLLTGEWRVKLDMETIVA